MSPTELDTPVTDTTGLNTVPVNPDVDLDEVPYDVEMSLFDHLEELRTRIFYGLIAVGLGIVLCFWQVNRIVGLLEVPALGANFLLLCPG